MDQQVRSSTLFGSRGSRRARSMHCTAIKPRPRSPSNASSWPRATAHRCGSRWRVRRMAPPFAGWGHSSPSSTTNSRPQSSGWQTGVGCRAAGTGPPPAVWVWHRRHHEQGGALGRRIPGDRDPSVRSGTGRAADRGPARGGRGPALRGGGGSPGGCAARPARALLPGQHRCRGVRRGHGHRGRLRDVGGGAALSESHGRSSTSTGWSERTYPSA